MSPTEANPLEPGTLYVISTPLGNLGDFSPRGREILAAVDVVLCEDTRVTAKLLAAFELPNKTLVSYRDATEQRDTPKWIEALQAGKTLGLVADAGTPTVSDPGFRLIRECRKMGLPVVPVPGPSAAITALSVSGLPTDAFLFVGFLPPKKAARQRFFTEHADDRWTLIFYESVHRIEKFLDDIVATLGPQRVICVARELTKKFETVHTGPAEAVRERVGRAAVKGEFVVLIAREGFDL